jgi:hypothetical protein
MLKIKADTMRKYKGEYHKAGSVFKIEDKDKDMFPEDAIIGKTKEELKAELEEEGKANAEEDAKQPAPAEEDGLEELTIEELYGILQEMDYDGRTKVRDEGEQAMIAAIREARSE